MASAKRFKKYRRVISLLYRVRKDCPGAKIVRLRQHIKRLPNRFYDFWGPWQQF